MTARAYRVQPRPTTVPVGPWRREQSAQQPQAGGQDVAYALANCYAEDADIGPVVVGVPGFAKMGAQLGLSGSRIGQRVVQFTKRGGTEYTVGFCDGLVYTYNWGSDTWTEILTTAELGAASITLDASAKVYCVTFADNLIVSDGVNTPWMWDGTAHGGLTELTNCPVLYGQPVVYYAKLFGIKNSARQTIVWSEEGQANTGYEAGGYNNAWDLIQTQTEGLVALAATNEALCYFRTNSCSAIYGAVSTDFKATGSREGLSDSIGTRSPAGVIVIGSRVWFMDQYGGFRVAQVGAGVKEVALGSRTILKDIPDSAFSSVVSAYDEEAGHVRFGIANVGQTTPSMEVRVNEETGEYAGHQNGYLFTTLDLVKDSSGTPTIVHTGGSDALSVDEGYAYAHGHPNGTVWSYGFADATTAIPHSLTTEYVGYDTRGEKLFTRLDLSYLPYTNLTGMQFSMQTPIRRSEALTLGTRSASGAFYEVAVYGVDSYATEAEESKFAIGLRERGRWCRFTLDHASLGERWGLNMMAVTMTAISQKTGVR